MAPTVLDRESFPILATASRRDEQARVLKHGDCFAVFDRSGNIRPEEGGELGLYHEGTRFLSQLELLLEGRRPLLLSSTVRQDNALVVDLTNPDLMQDGEVLLPRDTLHIFWIAFLWEEVCYVRWRIKNYAAREVDLRLDLRLAADFADVFEVRGTHRERRGRQIEPLAYEGLDGRLRRTRVSFSPEPAEMSGSSATFQVHLPPRGEQAWNLTFAFESGGQEPFLLDFDDALERSGAQLQARRHGCTLIDTAHERFDEWIERSLSDLHMMITETTKGPYPYAGIPWFSTVFGRDGILTALETLWIDPEPARGVLHWLASTQATETDPERDAEPGKILHEMRLGEMAALGEVPFGRYYGSIDATPLFVMLAGAYHQRTGDLLFLESIWPNVERALEWIDHHGDRDGDGFVEYARHSSRGLVQQGWKDSNEAVFHADGSLAEPPIALCEVQAYVFAARRHAARLAAALGHADRAERLERQAEELREAFERAFWCEEIGTYALALDGRKQPCRVRTSNAGHCLFAGIASPERARRVAETLMANTSFSGWGIRTLDSGEARYNPMSYHNGSVWPHDNAIVAAGLSRYGFPGMAATVLSGLFDASLHMDLQRMPELFCGFHRRQHEGPTLYPVACAPQSWAAASVFLLLQASLGLEIDAPAGRVLFRRPELPEGLKTVRIHNLTVGEASLDLVLERHALDVGIHLERREGEVEVSVLK